ncbi:amidohydrolase family protein [Flavitalea sp.]|nr:amidohydrolase family protein [Flavitalea sp.]
MKTRYQFLSFLVFCTVCSFDDVYYKPEDYTSVLKIDAHTHFRTESLVFSEKAKEDNFLLLDVNLDSPGEPELAEQQRLALFHISKFPDRVRFLSAFSLKNQNSPQWTNETIAGIRKSIYNGALGIKIWKNIGMYYKDASGRFILIDDPKFDSVINYLIKEDKTLLAHSGEPKNCWLPLEKMTVKNDQSYYKSHPQYHMYLHPEYPSYEQLINARDHFLEKHPTLRFVGAHLGSLEWNIDELAKRLDKFPNMAVDMAARIGHLQYQSITNYEKVRNFVIKYQDRLIYGTDLNNSVSDTAASRNYWHQTWFSDWNYFVTGNKMESVQVEGAFKGLRLPRTVVDKIYRLNAIRWFKIKL